MLVFAYEIRLHVVFAYQADQSAKNEAARYKLETEEAVANELSRIGTPASARY